jgi:hypothetical protein
MTRADNADLTKLAKLHEPGPRELACMFLIFVGSVVLLPPLLPLLIPVLLVKVAVDGHRVRRAARSFACVRCGALLGNVAVRLANRTWFAEERAAARRLPWGTFGRAKPRTLHAMCPACATRYTFVPVERTFEVESIGR